MEKDHKKIFNDIEKHLTSLRDLNGNYLVYTLNYIEEEKYGAIELLLFEQNHLSESFILNKILNKINKIDIVSDIYILDEYKTFVIHLLPLEFIRNNKLNKIKNRLQLVS